MKGKIIMIVLISSILLIDGSSSGSSFYDFNKFIQKGEFEKAKTILDTWDKDKDNDPQYYICLFNYHIYRSRTDAVRIQNKPPEGKTMQIIDPKTGQTVGYFGPGVLYDADEAQKGIYYLKAGINKFPDHYEMRFGLLYAYRELNEFEFYLTEFENALSYFKKNNLTKIYWNNNEIINEPSDFIIEMSQRCFSEIIGDENVPFDPKFAYGYCDLLIKYFPEHKYGYSDKGVIYYKSNELKNALEYFLKAYSIDPNDELIAFNIGSSYKELNDRNNARIYFKKVLEISKNSYYIDRAKEQLKLLEKN